jgi:hypothetical protein
MIRLVINKLIKMGFRVSFNPPLDKDRTRCVLTFDYLEMSSDGIGCEQALYAALGDGLLSALNPEKTPKGSNYKKVLRETLEELLKEQNYDD